MACFICWARKVPLRNLRWKFASECLVGVVSEIRRARIWLRMLQLLGAWIVMVSCRVVMRWHVIVRAILWPSWVEARALKSDIVKHASGIAMLMH